MTGMTARSTSLSALNWDANLLKTVGMSVGVASECSGFYTQAWSEEHDIEIGRKLLHFRIEQALTGDNVAWQTNTYYF